MLLTLTLPLQGLAAASMLECTLAEAAPASMQMDDPTMAGCHESDDSSVPEQHDCKHCAACALASALPVLAGDQAVVPALHAYAPQPAAAFSGFVPEGPERPPRPALA